MVWWGGCPTSRLGGVVPADPISTLTSLAQRPCSIEKV